LDILALFVPPSENPSPPLGYLPAEAAIGEGAQECCQKATLDAFAVANWLGIDSTALARRREYRHKPL
jgi:hypothetical protein